MPGKPTYVVQQFKRVRGRLVPGDKEIAPTESGAKKRAAAIASRVPAVAVLCLTVDEEGELVSAKILETHGEIPDDFAESLQGG